MKNVRIFFTLSSALIIAASVYGVSADARKSSLNQCLAGGLSKAECACEMALQSGTKKALRDFLKLYRNADTACNATASTEKSREFSNNGGELGSSSSSSSSSSGGSSNGGSSNGGSSNGGSSNGGSSNGGSSNGGSSNGGSSNGGSSNGGSSNGGSSNGGSSNGGGGNPGNDKPVGKAGESPNGHDFGDGVKGKSQ